jgi:hypothetical protein
MNGMRTGGKRGFARCGNGSRHQRHTVVADRLSIDILVWAVRSEANLNLCASSVEYSSYPP